MKHGTAEPAAGEQNVKTPDDQAKDSWNSFFSTIGKEFSADPNLLRAALKEAVEALNEGVDVGSRGGIRSVEDPAGIALTIWIPGTVTNDQIRTEFVSRLLPLGLDVDRALIGVANIGQRIEDAAGDVKMRRFDIVIPADGYTLDKTGMFVAASTEAHAIEKLRQSIVDRDDAISQVRESKRDKILEELEARRADREDARRAKDAEQALAEEKERSAKLQAEIESLRDQFIKATGEAPVEVSPVESQVTQESLAPEAEAKPTKVKLIKEKATKTTEKKSTKTKITEGKATKKKSTKIKVKPAKVKPAKTKRVESKRIAEAKRLHKNEQARMRRAEARQAKIEAEQIAEERRVRRNELARIRRAAKKSATKKTTKKSTAKKSKSKRSR